MLFIYLVSILLAFSSFFLPLTVSFILCLYDAYIRFIMDCLAFSVLEQMFTTWVRYVYYMLFVYLQNTHVTTYAGSSPLFSVVNINMCPNLLSNGQLQLKIKHIDISHHSFHADFCENNIVPTYTPCHIQHLLLDDTNDTFVNSDLSFACIMSSHQSIRQSTLIIPYTQLSSYINIQWINQ